MKKHKNIVAWLKTEHGISQSYANYAASQTLKANEGLAGGGDEVDALFAGPKSALKPLYDELVATVKTFGDDLEIAPKKNNVSVRRSKQFALLQPSKATRLDVGLILKALNPLDGSRLPAASTPCSRIACG